MKTNSGLLVVLSGPSGSGKDALLDELRKTMPDLMISISSTTREKRENEIDGVHYRFITRELFEKMIATGELLEFAEYGVGKYYGTPLKPVQAWLAEGKTVILKIEVQGADKIKETYPDAVSIFLMPPSLAVLEKRLRDRETDSEESIRMRMKIAREKEIPKAVEYNYIVLNDELMQAVSDVKSILTTEKLRPEKNLQFIEEVRRDAES